MCGLLLMYETHHFNQTLCKYNLMVKLFILYSDLYRTFQLTLCYMKGVDQPFQMFNRIWRSKVSNGTRTNPVQKCCLMFDTSWQKIWRRLSFTVEKHNSIQTNFFETFENLPVGFNGWFCLENAYMTKGAFLIFGILFLFISWDVFQTRECSIHDNLTVCELLGVLVFGCCECI